MITDEVIDVSGVVRVSLLHGKVSCIYLEVDNQNFLIAHRPLNHFYDGMTLNGRARLWTSGAWEGELIEWSNNNA